MWCDTNVLLATLITKDTGPDKIYRLFQADKFTLITSEYPLQELQEVARYPRLAKWLKPREVRAMVRYLRLKAVLVPDDKTVSLSPDPDDDPILAMVLSGGAKYIVSRDKPHVLALGRVKRVRILTVAEFLKLMG